MEEREDIIYLNSNINEIFATTELIQYFSNPLESSIELTISFQIHEEINLTKFIITVDDKIYISKIMPKEKAEEKYNDAISSGNIGLLSKYEDEKMTNYTVNIGNINPKQKVKLNAFFIQKINSYDMSYEFNIMKNYPTFHFKESNSNKQQYSTIKANFKIETQSKITRLISPFNDQHHGYEVAFDDDYKKVDIKYSGNIYNKSKKDEFEKKINKEIFPSNFCILFRTENMNKPILYYQYNPELKETSYSINYIYKSKNLKDIPIPIYPDQDNTISYYSKYEENNINDTPSLFIFLIDQSGSMYGRPIKLVKESLLLFIQSLPKGSYFQLIGFGSSYEKYNKEPVEYNKFNVQNTINLINNLEADLGGTNINKPLEDIYKDYIYDNIKLSKNIFLLTDGEVENRDECINIINKNSNKFRFHSLGIGNDFDKELIEKTGTVGKGSYTFVENVEGINSAVIETLNKSLRPYLLDIQFNFLNYKNNDENSIIKCKPKKFIYQNEIINYSFILDEKNKIDIDNLSESINIEIAFNDPINYIKNKVSFNRNNIIKLQNGDGMAKMIVGKALKNNTGLKNDEKKEIEFSKKYQILSKNTALFAEILNNDNQKSELIKINLNDYNNSLNYRLKKDLDNSNYNSNSYKSFNSNSYQSSYGLSRSFGASLHRNNVSGTSRTIQIRLENDHAENMRLINKSEIEKCKIEMEREMRKLERESERQIGRMEREMEEMERNERENERRLLEKIEDKKKAELPKIEKILIKEKEGEKHLEVLKKIEYERKKDGEQHKKELLLLKNDLTKENDEFKFDLKKFDLEVAQKHDLKEDDINNKNDSFSKLNSLLFFQNNYNNMQMNIPMNQQMYNPPMYNTMQMSPQIQPMYNNMQMNPQMNTPMNQQMYNKPMYNNMQINPQIQSMYNNIPMFNSMNLNNQSNNSQQMNGSQNNMQNLGYSYPPLVINDIKINLMNLIMSQDIDEGFWNENEETKKLNGIITEDKINKIKNKIKELNKVEQEIKIIYTILVIYYLSTEHSQKIKDYKLIIHKANKFLMSHGIKYEDFILQIGL